MQRVFKHGGQLYRVATNKNTEMSEVFYAESHKEFLEIDQLTETTYDLAFGPWRVRPGGLSV